MHAAFVVLESVAACFVARSFFDNVIGLEKIVKKRTDDLRLVLDNVGQGFLSINLDGSLSAERSAIVDTVVRAVRARKAASGSMSPGWRPVSPDGSAWAGRRSSRTCCRWTWRSGSFPKRWKIGPRSFSLDYRPVMSEGKLSKVVLVISDITAELERERFEAEQRDFLRVFEHIAKDKQGFQSFFAEGSEIVSRIIGAEGGGVELRRQIHTLKGNCALFGLSRLAAFCHDLESGMAEENGAISTADRARLGEIWGTFVAHLRALLGRERTSLVEVEHAEYTSILAALAGDVAREEIAWRIRAWEFEAADRSLGRVADQARAIAGRLGKPAPTVAIEANGVRLLPERWAEFWSAFTHVVRNAVDHGLETAEERASAGKPAKGALRLCTSLVNDDFTIEISDDGRGIDWQAAPRASFGDGPSLRHRARSHRGDVSRRRDHETPGLRVFRSRHRHGRGARGLRTHGRRGARRQRVRRGNHGAVLLEGHAAANRSDRPRAALPGRERGERGADRELHGRARPSKSSARLGVGPWPTATPIRRPIRWFRWPSSSSDCASWMRRSASCASGWPRSGAGRRLSARRVARRVRRRRTVEVGRVHVRRGVHRLVPFPALPGQQRLRT